MRFAAFGAVIFNEWVDAAVAEGTLRPTARVRPETFDYIEGTHDTFGDDYPPTGEEYVAGWRAGRWLYRIRANSRGECHAIIRALLDSVQRTHP